MLMPGKIFLSFRFHGNFYHSYRGDTPDELGFGKDIRIIRNTIKVLDALNAAGIPVRGTWDFENYFSLEKIMPEHCPDIIEGMKRRVFSGMDEIEYMSYNNGLVSGSTVAEFDAAIGRAVTNAQGSGLKDIFGDNVKPIVRPQEMMSTPAHLKHYVKHGIKTISLFYSSIPFNGFSTFVKPLTLVERHNPLTLTYPGIEETMTLLPCYNAGDLLDNLGLKNWVSRLRKQQLRLEEPKDLLLIIDMDADDEFWSGFNVPVLSRMMATAQGLRGIVKSVAGLDFIEFTTPGRYLETHEAEGEVSFGQDTADGSFDGLSSWAEKWDNHVLWTGIERSRILELQAGRLGGGSMPEAAGRLLEESFNARVKALSTTHFGMAAPVMNVTRLNIAAGLVKESVDKAAMAFEIVKKDQVFEGDFMLIDYSRKDETSQENVKPVRALVKIPVTETCHAISSNGNQIKTAFYDGHLYFRESFRPEEKKVYSIVKSASQSIDNPVTLSETVMDNGLVNIKFDGSGNIEGITVGNNRYSLGTFMNTSVTYGSDEYCAASWSTSISESNDVIGVKKMAGSLVFDADGLKVLEVEREIILATGLPYIYVNMTVRYPQTPHRQYDRGKAKRLQQSWDGNWKEVMPCEIRPAVSGNTGNPIKVWKNNYFNHVSSFNLDYGEFSKNAELDSFNNQITNAWVAVTDGRKGLLIAQSADVLSGMAFCPMRTRLEEGVTRIRMNPFGSYSGRQWSYPTAYTGIGKLIAVHASASDHIKPYAPSYNGRVQKFSLMIAPYAGDCPPEEIRNDALAFSYPYILLSGNPAVGIPGHRKWDVRL
jgi:hypothetical protein